MNYMETALKVPNYVTLLKTIRLVMMSNAGSHNHKSDFSV